ncbi:hypothetical protein K523DRAFT_359301 [Schizophyllum commune Tattone D]|nr:hypothetical protein K523DRAFT_359301 [Schizophyllum commune Tattone D]
MALPSPSPPFAIPLRMTAQNLAIRRVLAPPLVHTPPRDASGRVLDAREADRPRARCASRAICVLHHPSPHIPTISTALSSIFTRVYALARHRALSAPTRLVDPLPRPYPSSPSPRDV